MNIYVCEYIYIYIKYTFWGTSVVTQTNYKCVLYTHPLQLTTTDGRDGWTEDDDDETVGTSGQRRTTTTTGWTTGGLDGQTEDDDDDDH